MANISVISRRYPYSNLAFYYESYLVTVPVTGYYLFTSISSINTYGYFYATNFSACSPSTNLITYDDDSGGSSQFQITMSILANTPYVLVVTTFVSNIRGAYTVVAAGLNRVNLTLQTNRSFSSTTTISTSNTASVSNTVSTSTITARPGGSPPKSVDTGLVSIVMMW